MFGFLRKRAAREHLKLSYQNVRALAFLGAFLDSLEAEKYEIEMYRINANWEPGTPMNNEDALSMFNMNRDFRHLYDRTPAKYIKSFDEEYTPLLGWKDYYSDYQD